MVPPLLRSSRVKRRRRSSSVRPFAEAPLELDAVGRCREYGAAPARASRPWNTMNFTISEFGVAQNTYARSD